MFTVYQRKRTWNIRCFFPAFLVLLCFEEIYSSLSNTSYSIDEACSNGTSITLTWTAHGAPYVFDKNSRVQGILVDIVEKGISICCQVGIRISYNNTNIKSKRFKNMPFNNLHVPASTRSYLERKSYGQPVLGLVDSPGIAVITQASVPGADLLLAILDSWPILIFIITTISLSGVMIWLLDYKKNPRHFPHFFPMGVFEGFWWAAVTMTTVGYGDKVPKSVGGRLFAVLWINAGLVILAMFMGIVTASLASSSWVDINHFWGIEVAVINGSAEYQFAILQSANVKAQESYEDMYSSVAFGASKIALVDQYTATCHQELFSRYKLTIATIINVPVVYGIVLPAQGSRTFQQCLQSYSTSYKVEIYSHITKYLINTQDNSVSDGTEYFRGSMFGYSVYAMSGVFLLILGIGVYWQYYWQPRHGEWNQSKALKELEMMPTNHLKAYPRINHIAHVQTAPRQDHPTPHCSRTQQCMGARQLLDEYREYEKSWTKRFIYLQEKHRREQVEVFNLDNDGYNM